MKLRRSVGALIQIAGLLWQAKIASDVELVHRRIDQRAAGEPDMPPPPPGLNGLVLLGLIIPAWTGATFLTMWRLHRSDGVTDAVAYLSPIIAAILAGGGVFARRANRSTLERHLYWASVAMLGVGEVGYVLSKGGTVASLGTFLGFMFVVLVGGLLYDFYKSSGPKNNSDWWIFGLLVFVAILSPGVLFFYDMPASTVANAQASTTCTITLHNSAAITITPVTSADRIMIVQGAPGPSAFHNVPTGSFMFTVPCEASDMVTIPVTSAQGRTKEPGANAETTLTPTLASSRP